MVELALENSTDSSDHFQKVNSIDDSKEFWANASDEMLKRARDELDEHLRRRRIKKDGHFT